MMAFNLKALFEAESVADIGNFPARHKFVGNFISKDYFAVLDKIVPSLFPCVISRKDSFIYARPVVV